jgi:hypothetical protein
MASSSVATYAVRLNFEGHLTGNPWFDAEVLVADPATPGVDVLVGMDVISQLAWIPTRPNSANKLARTLANLSMQ